MVRKKYLMMAGGLTTLGMAGTIGLQSAWAAPQSNQTLADKIATTFHLNKNDVQKLIDQDREAHETERQQKLDEQLTQAVKDGKITAAQKTLILNKLSELRKQHDANMQLTPTQRRAAMHKELAGLKAWAKANNIPINLLVPATGPGPSMPGDDRAPDN